MLGEIKSVREQKVWNLFTFLRYKPCFCAQNQIRYIGCSSYSWFLLWGGVLGLYQPSKPQRSKIKLFLLMLHCKEFWTKYVISEIKFSVGCIVWPWCWFQHWTFVKYWWDFFLFHLLETETYFWKKLVKTGFVLSLHIWPGELITRP